MCGNVLYLGSGNCYITVQAELKAVSPSEDFTCSLGVDPGIRVVYKPVYKNREQSGLLTKSVVTTYKQVFSRLNDTGQS